MKHVLRRTAVICLAVPAITLLGASAALADCQPSHSSSPSASASSDPFPKLTADGTDAVCSIHGDGHSHSSGSGSDGMSDMPGMDMPGMDMPGMDMPGMSGSHTHTHTTTTDTDTDHPRTAVLSAFGVVNAGVMTSAAVVRRRSRTAKKKGARR